MDVPGDLLPTSSSASLQLERRRQHTPSPQVLSWSSVRGDLSGTPPPQISSAPETMWFSQVCHSFYGGRVFTFSEDRLSPVCTKGDNSDSGQKRCFRGRH